MIPKGLNTADSIQTANRGVHRMITPYVIHFRLFNSSAVHHRAVYAVLSATSDRYPSRTIETPNMDPTPHSAHVTTNPSLEISRGPLRSREFRVVSFWFATFATRKRGEN
eukprot:1181246-Prorocentrum_minimum.AAC.1